MKTKSLPVNLKGFLGWRFRVNDRRRIADGHSLLGKGANELRLMGVDACAVQVGALSVLGEKARRLELAARPALPAVPPRPLKPPSVPAAAVAGAVAGEPSSSDSESNDSACTSASTSSSSSTDTEEAELAEEVLPPLLKLPDVEYCAFASALPQTQAFYRGWKTSYRAKAPEQTDTKKLFAMLQRRQHRFEHLAGELPRSRRAALP